MLILTGDAAPTRLAAALRIGVSGYLLKDSPADDLMCAVRMAARGERIIDARLVSQLPGREEGRRRPARSGPARPRAPRLSFPTTAPGHIRGHITLRSAPKTTRTAEISIAGQAARSFRLSWSEEPLHQTRPTGQLNSPSPLPLTVKCQRRQGVQQQSAATGTVRHRPYMTAKVL